MSRLAQQVQRMTDELRQSLKRDRVRAMTKGARMEGTNEGVAAEAEATETATTAIADVGIEPDEPAGEKTMAKQKAKKSPAKKSAPKKAAKKAAPPKAKAAKTPKPKKTPTASELLTRDATVGLKKKTKTNKLRINTGVPLALVGRMLDAALAGKAVGDLTDAETFHARRLVARIKART